MTKEDFKPIDVRQYKVTETGQVLKMTRAQKMPDEEIVAEYAKGLTNEYQDGLVDIDDIDVLKEAIVEAHLAGLKAGRDTAEADLAKAKELLKWALHSDPEHDNLVDFDTKWNEAKQFLKEVSE